MLKLVRLFTEEQVAEPCRKPVNMADNGSAPMAPVDDQLGAWGNLG